MKVGLVVHAGRNGSVQLATYAARGLIERGIDVVVARGAEPSDDQAVLEDVATAVDEAGFGDELDLALSFGGDGTFLRAAHLSRDAGVPVMGVNLGRLGFLAEIELDDLDGALDTVAAASFVVEERSTLEATVLAADGSTVGSGWALNEVSIEKTARQRLLLMDLAVDGDQLAQLPADALVIATSTGSTAYALSAGGPIVSPHLDAILVVPVAPHTLFDRTVVVGPGEEVTVSLVGDQAPALVSCDGRAPLTAEAGSRVVVRGGGRPVRIARVGDLDFYGLVRRKFGLR